MRDDEELTDQRQGVGSVVRSPTKSTCASPAIEEGDVEGFEDFIALHPDLARSDLLGPPAWRTQ